ncbi:hypothetical protein [Formicincola oecophyllae]|uniref:hypothetical protein n=1 Tax=Formicincola oecophyllae TaxID=2558361 RepID=UPI0019D166D7|nr:hypothetical protein [Formicincola oecophyllae]
MRLNLVSARAAGLNARCGISLPKPVSVMLGRRRLCEAESAHQAPDRPMPALAARID